VPRSSLSRRALIRVILDRYLYREQIADLLDDLEDDASGSKDLLMRRLLQNRGFDPRHALELLGKDELAGLCRQRGKYDGADRTILIQQLVGVIAEESGLGPDAARFQHTDSKLELWKELHPSVVRVARSRFESHQYADSVEAAMKEVIDRVKAHLRASGQPERDGKDLMLSTFSPKAPFVKLSPLETISQRDEQEGYMHIFAGAVQAIRNPKAHSNVTIDEARAFHHLFLASLLMYKLDEAGVA
jgi:uncharacterized protein (TIGR02391 family)